MKLIVHIALLAQYKGIADHVQSCVPCQSITKSQQKELAIPMEVPSMPRKTLGMD